MLTKEQIEERRKGIGASDAPYIVDGRWYDLWLLKTGRAEGPDLSDVFAVQLGIATESLNLDWYVKKTGHKITRGNNVVMAGTDFMRCTLDAMDLDDMALVEAKHVNGFSKLDEIVARYTPQCQHQMIVTGARRAILSVIIGTNEPELVEIPYDEFWCNDYIEQCRTFWGYVERDEEPEGATAMAPPPPPISDMRTVDMSGSNEWAFHAADWVLHKADAKKFEEAAKSLKKLVEADVCRAHGNGIEIKRSKVGLSIKEQR